VRDGAATNPTPPSEPKDVISDKSTSKDNVTEEENDALLAAFRTTHSNDMFISKSEGKQAVAVLNTHWSADVKADPEGLASQLSNMVTKELFHIQEVSTKTACLIQDPRLGITFKEDSCKVNNVALLSARAQMFIEKKAEVMDGPGLTAGHQQQSSSKYEEVEYDPDNEDSFSGAAIAAQLEVLYDVTQEFTMMKKTTEGSTTDSSNNNDFGPTEHTTFVGVATLQGWLQGGPDDGELRWRLALHRPAYEFPGIEQAY
jgi:hypothetical protein